MLKVDINLLFEIINLLVLFIAFKFVLFKPVQKIIAQRQEEADRENEDAIKAKEEAELKKKEYEDNLLAIEKEKKQILSETHKSANEEYVRIVEEANVKAHKLREEAKKSAEREKEQILKTVEGDIADMVVEAAGKIIAGHTDNQALYDEFINDKAGEN